VSVKLPAQHAERLGGLEVDRQLVLSRRLHWQVGRLLALENTINVISRAPVLVDRIGPYDIRAPPLTK
jgi:hypothetical protein